MVNLNFPEIDFSKIRTQQIVHRQSKVSISSFSEISEDDSFDAFIDSLPGILAGSDIRSLTDAIYLANSNKFPVLAMMGGHVIKCGLSPFIIRAIKKGWINAVAMNGAASIHDFEIAMIGETSESVEDSLPKGTWGMSEETGRLMNTAISEGYGGIGLSLGKLLYDNQFTFIKHSILANAYEKSIPSTVHVAIGTDIIHQHPSCDGAALGRESQKDFQKLVSVVSALQGGVVLNFGSAVIMPEVYSKALNVARNLGYEVSDFTIANFDIKEQYRVTQNLLKRPGGRSYSFIGHHEIMIPLLFTMLGRKHG